VSKRVKAKFNLKQHFFFEPENPKQPTPLKFPEEKNPSPPGPHEMVSSFIVRNCMSASSFLVMW